MEYVIVDELSLVDDEKWSDLLLVVGRENVLLDLLGQSENDEAVLAARRGMLADPRGEFD